MSYSHPIASSTPALKLNSSRPLPVFLNESHQLFTFKKEKQLHFKTSRPKSPIKSAPPVSRVFPRRNRLFEKAHAVSFRETNSLTNDSTLCSRFYDSQSSELYFKQCFVIVKKLGEGSFGEVMQVRSKDNDQMYAVKRSRDKFRNESDRRRKLDEVKKHERLPIHPNCVKFIKAWEEKQRLYIQTELCSTSLQRYLEEHHSIPMHFVWKCMVDLLQGLEHIHSHGFIHFDVKPANIFLSEDGTCKIGDFGLVFDRLNDDMHNAREGDNKYMAPELLDGIFSEKADVFSLGIAMLEICCDLDLPSSGASWQLLRSGYLPEKCTNIIPFSLLTVIRWLLSPDPAQRPAIVDVLNHPNVKCYQQRLQVNFFFSNCMQRLAQTFYISLATLCYVLGIPYKVFLSFLSPNLQLKTFPLKRKSNSHWNDSSSTEGIVNIEKPSKISDSSDFSDNEVIIATPHGTPNSMHFMQTPKSPRSSSPVSHLSGNSEKHCINLSPLSHYKNKQFYYKKSTTNSDITDDLVFIDNEEADIKPLGVECKFSYSQPRCNLLDMLNEAACSDTSITSEEE